MSQSIPPVNTEVKRINEFIDTRNLVLGSLTEQRNKEQAQLEMSEKAISNLTVTIARAKKVLASHKSILYSLNSMKGQYNISEWTQVLEMQDETQTSELCSRLATQIDNSFKRGSVVVQDQVTSVEQEVQELSNQIFSLESELAGWKFTRDLANDNIMRYNSSIESINVGVESARLPFSSRYNVPKEIWVAIFQLCLSLELEEYLRATNSSLFRPIPVVLSLVCSNWRDIIREEPKLWSFINIYPCQRLPESKGNLLFHSARQAGSGIVFVSNLAYRVPWETDSARDPFDYYFNTRRYPKALFSALRN
ncbi:hypothetical protein CPB86DRAFT_830150 [Serendipita vermifera]|nr:hypothetical protein CPB86DRAFT_830150 [Serendipita vermifera]